MNSVSPSCPPYGQNSLGVAKRANGNPLLVRIEHIGAGHMLHCREVDTLRSITIHATDFDPMPTIPSKYREYNFTVLAPYWAQALAIFPKVLVIDPSTLSGETLARKLRESRVAKETYKWKSPLVDEAKWAETADKIVISLSEKGQVTMGERQGREQVEAQVRVLNDAAITLRLSNTETREAFCSLVSQRVFGPNVQFIVTDLDETTITDLENRYDVGFVPQEDGHSHKVIF